MNFYPFHIGDYAAHTARLSLMEDLAYRRLIDAYYLAEKPLEGTAKEVAREIGMLDHVNDVEYVLNRFFVFENGTYRNARCDDEIEKYKDKAEKASKAGKASAKAREKAKQTNEQQTLNESATDVEIKSNGRATNQEPRTKNQYVDLQNRSQDHHGSRFTGAGALSRGDDEVPDGIGAWLCWLNETHGHRYSLRERTSGKVPEILTRWTANGITKAQINDAIETARSRGDPIANIVCYVDAILSNPTSKKRIQDERAETIAALTGRNDRQGEQRNERVIDITPNATASA